MAELEELRGQVTAEEVEEARQILDAEAEKDRKRKTKDEEQPEPAAV